MADNYEVRLDNPDLSPDTVTVKSPSLLKGLIKSPDATLKLLSTKFSPVSLQDIDIDQHGQVVIKDKLFRDALENTAAATGSSAGNNCNC